MLNLFFPHLCCGCNRSISAKSLVLCASCIHKLPINIPNNLIINEFTANFFGRVPLVYGLSVLEFQREGLSQKLLHQLKYKGVQQIGSYFGQWTGNLLAQNELTNPIDLVIPVPLSKKRYRKRGYNQVFTFAQAIATALNIPCNKSTLIKTEEAASKVFLKRDSRFKVNQEPFKLNQGVAPLKGKHILVVDDVVTTGATLESCAKVLLKIPEISLSFATIAMA